MKLGIGSYTLAWAVGVAGHRPFRPLTAMALCERAVAMGVRVVQFADNLSLARLGEEEVSAVEAYARAHGLEVELGTRGILAGDLAGHLALAKRFGAGWVRLVLDGPGHEPTAEEAVRLLRPEVERYAEAGVRLAIENHDRFRAATLAGMVEALGAERVGVTLDTVNSFGALEGPEVVVRELAPHVLNLHLKDFIIRRVPSQMGFVVEGCPAGEGRLDIPWLLGELRRGNAGWSRVNAVIELWTPPAATVEATIERESAWAEASVRRLREWISE